MDMNTEHRGRETRLEKLQYLKTETKDLDREGLLNESQGYKNTNYTMYARRYNKNTLEGERRSAVNEEQERTHAAALQGGLAA